MQKRKGGRKLNQSGNVFIRLAYFVIFIIGLYLMLAIVDPFYDLLLPLLDNAAFAPYNILLKAAVVLLIPAFVVFGIMFIFSAPTRVRADDYL